MPTRTAISAKSKPDATQDAKAQLDQISMSLGILRRELDIGAINIGSCEKAAKTVRDLQRFCRLLPGVAGLTPADLVLHAAKKSVRPEVRMLPDESLKLMSRIAELSATNPDVQLDQLTKLDWIRQGHPRLLGSINRLGTLGLIKTNTAQQGFGGGPGPWRVTPLGKAMLPLVKKELAARG